MGKLWEVFCFEVGAWRFQSLLWLNFKGFSMEEGHQSELIFVAVPDSQEKKKERKKLIR